MGLADYISDLKSELRAEDESLVTLHPTDVEIYDIFSGGGLPRGGFVEFVGNPGAGKTTLALQILGQVQKTQDCIISIIDAERSITAKRLQAFGLDPNKVILVQRGITVEKIFDDRIQKIVAYKEKKKIKDLPVYILWDSIAHTPAEKELEVTDLNQAIGVKAKVLNNLLRKYDEMLLEYNITIIAINQLTSKVGMGNMYVKQVQINGLGDRTVPGGTGQYFVAFHFLALDKKSDLSGSEFGFKGAIVQGKFLKNKAAVPFEDFYMVLDFKKGFNMFWTKFIYLKEAKIIKVNGGWYTLEGYTDESGKLKKFRGSSSLEKYNTDPKFKEAFDKYWNVLADELKKALSDEEKIEELNKQAEGNIGELDKE